MLFYRIPFYVHFLYSKCSTIANTYKNPLPSHTPHFPVPLHLLHLLTEEEEDEELEDEGAYELPEYEGYDVLYIP